MPGGYPVLESVCNAQGISGVGSSANANSGYGAVITAGSTANTKGAWTQLIASSTNDCCRVDLAINFCSIGYSVGTMSFDIGVGASGSETIIIADLNLDCLYNGYSNCFVSLPIQISAGTRVSARCQSNSASAIGCVNIWLYDGSFEVEGCSGVDALGFVSASTTGTPLTPSATVNTMGSYAQIVASTARDYVGLFGMHDWNGNAQIAGELIDIAIGASGSEVVILPTRSTYGGSVQYSQQLSYGAEIFLPFVPIQIPAGTRIAARNQFSIASAVGSCITLYGVYK